jgi:hypothetical protein
MPQHFRFYLSSPGDVADERRFAQQVIEQELPKDPLLRGRLTCEVVRHDDPAAPAPMTATQTPQESVDENLPAPSDCDVVIVILWSRLGSPLSGPKYRKPDGTPYRSGTEWEFDDAVNPRNRKPPHVLVYFRTTQPPFTAADKDFDEKLQQMANLRQFLRQFDKVDGTYRRGFATYESPQQFRDRLASDLRMYVSQRLDRDSTPPKSASPPPPCGAIAQALASGRVIPFLGPGLLTSGREAQIRWDPATARFLPSGEELSRFLADEAHLPSGTDHEHLAEIASFYEAVASRPSLRERLHEIFGSAAVAQAVIPPLYALLAEVRGATLIVTTNYDTLLERAFHAVGRPYDLVVYPAERKDLANAVLWWPHGAAAPMTPAPNELDIDLDKTSVILKMHGTIQPETDRWDGTVITEGDFVEFLSRLGNNSAIPAVLSARINDRSLLFLGFNVDDWSSRSILRNLKRRAASNGEETPSWAIASRFSELERLVWRTRSVYPFEMDLDEFAHELRERLLPVTVHAT